MDTNSIVGLAAFFALCFATASSGAIFRPGEWYQRLEKPSWTPPNWVFPVVWTLLFICMAFSGWLVWLEVGLVAGAIPLGLFGLNLVLNALWSGLFFGLRRPDLGMIEVVFLWASIAAMVVVFYPIHTVAALLMVPYLVWVTIAAALNYSIWRLNPSASTGPAQAS
jgi:tryptophan-rich sensory protein